MSRSPAAIRVHSTPDQSIYVATDGAGHHKIGVTNNIENRFRVMRDQNGIWPTLVYIRGPLPDAGWAEIAAHTILVRKHLDREWFDVTEDEAVAAVERGVAEIEAGIYPTSRPNLKTPDIVRLGPAGDFAEGLTWLARIRRSLSESETLEAFVAEAIRREIDRRA